MRDEGIGVLQEESEAKAPGAARYVVLVILAFVAVAYIAVSTRSSRGQLPIRGDAGLRLRQAGGAVEQGAVALRSEGNAMAEMQEGSGAAPRPR